MWFLIPLALAAGYGFRLLVAPSIKSEVVRFTTNNSLIDQDSSLLKQAGIDHEVDTDGVNSWIMVTPDNRTKAVQVIKQNEGLPKPPTNE
jgi:hypothetical protein